MLGVAALGTYAGTGVAQIVLGGIQTLIFEDMGWDRGTVAMAVTAGTWTSGLLTPFMGRVADRYGPRGLMPVAALIVGVAYFGLAGVQQVWHFYVAYIVGRAIANPILVGVVPRTVSVNFFQRKRNLALGLTTMARPLSNAAHIQLIVLIALLLSWRAAYLFLGVVSLVMVVPLWQIMRRRPEDIGMVPDGTPSSATRAMPRAQPDWKSGEAVLTSTFWFIVGAQILEIITSGTIGFQVVPYLRDEGASLALASAALSANLLLGALANPLVGYLSDKSTPKAMALIVTIITGTMCAMFLVAGSPTSIFWVVVVWGIFSGSQGVLINMMLAYFFGRSSYGAISGLVGPFQIGAVGSGPILGALLFARTGSYAAMFIFGVIAYVVALACILATRTPRHPRDRTQSPGQA